MSTPIVTPSAQGSPALPLPALIDWARAQPSRIGYFAALYHHVCAAVDVAVARGEFQHPDELLALKEIFLGRYVTAVTAFRDGGQPTRAWELSFEAAATEHLCVLQHLMLGINAHINYDLAIAVSTAVGPERLPDFRHDFDCMNAILTSLVKDMAADLALVVPALGAINRIFGREDKLLVQAVMVALREIAWRRALELSTATDGRREATLAEMDRDASALAQAIVLRRTPIRRLIRAIQHCERGGVAQVIDDLMQR